MIKRKNSRNLFRETASKKGLLLIPLIVVIELVYVLEKIYRLSKVEIREKIEGLETLPVIELESEDEVLEALRLYAEEDLKFGDAMILAKARISGIKPVYTFDKDFKRFPEANMM
ncbi:MAG: PIN domain-containing protein [Nitrospirae bacterium]|nr:PIN domain-containing protein [Nitrospirota bacterium]